MPPWTQPWLSPLRDGDCRQSTNRPLSQPLRPSLSESRQVLYLPPVTVVGTGAPEAEAKEKAKRSWGITKSGQEPTQSLPSLPPVLRRRSKRRWHHWLNKPWSLQLPRPAKTEVEVEGNEDVEALPRQQRQQQWQQQQQR